METLIQTVLISMLVAGLESALVALYVVGDIVFTETVAYLKGR